MAELQSPNFIFMPNQNIPRLGFIITNTNSLVITYTNNQIMLMRAELSIKRTITMRSNINKLLVIRRVEQPQPAVRGAGQQHVAVRRQSTELHAVDGLAVVVGGHDAVHVETFHFVRHHFESQVQHHARFHCFGTQGYFSPVKLVPWTNQRSFFAELLF